MVVITKAAARGLTDLGWLRSRHTFSFGGYQDASRTGIGPLRVLNDDTVSPNREAILEDGAEGQVLIFDLPAL